MPTDQESQRSTQARREQIAEMLLGKGSVRVNELSALFQVSEVTIRNDLMAMAREGRLVRNHGGAIARTQTSLSTEFDQRAQESREEKQRIGRAAAQLLLPGETVIMDAGSTLMEMAKCIEPLDGLTIVTTALNVATQVMASSGVHAILAGGSISPQTISTVGAIAERDIDEFRVDKLFLGTHAFSFDDGLMDVSVEVARVKMSMIQAARMVILLADSSKWGRAGFVRVAPLSVVDVFICDKGLPELVCASFADRNRELILV